MNPWQITIDFGEGDKTLAVFETENEARAGLQVLEDKNIHSNYAKKIEEIPEGNSTWIVVPSWESLINR